MNALLVVALLTCVGSWMAQAPSIHWSPYQVGAGIGVLSWLTFYFSDKPLGASSAYATVAGVLGRQVAPNHTAKLAYFQEHPPKLIKWENIFLLTAVLGAFLAALSSGDFSPNWLPPLWVSRFGEDSLFLRFLFAFGGGVIMALGARLAGGCTSGHGISGTLQLALSSWITVISLFVGGIVTAKWIFGGLS